MALDVHEVDRVAEAGRLEQVPGVGPQHRQLGQLLAVALEVAVVDGVEPGQRREQADVGLGDRVADEVALVREPLRQPVEAGEQAVVGPLVGPLRPGEAAAVDAVVDVGVDDVVDLVDLVAAGLGIQVGSAVPVVLAATRVDRSSVSCGDSRW